MKTPIGHLSRKVLLLSSSVALTALLPSCLPPPLPYHVRAVGRGGPGYYETLPSGYRGDYYQHDGRYYYGGRHETGRYRYEGREYGNRYYHGGQYYYGGQYSGPGR